MFLLLRDPSIRERRARKKWQAKLNGLQAQIASGKENLFLLEAALHNAAEAAAEKQPAAQPLACFSDWGQDETVPLPPAWITENNTAIVDAGASGLFFKSGAPVANINKKAPKITVGTASGDPHVSSAECELDRPELRGKVPIKGHVMPSFTHNLMGISQFCDADCMVQYTKKEVTIFNPRGEPLVKGWRDPKTKLWRIAIVSGEEQQTFWGDPGGEVVSLDAFSAYDLPSVEALVRFFHAAAGYPVKATWLNAIKEGYYSSWPGLTYSNASKYCPAAVPTSKGHMSQGRQG